MSRNASTTFTQAYAPGWLHSTHLGTGECLGNHSHFTIACSPLVLDNEDASDPAGQVSLAQRKRQAAVILAVSGE
jgi:hypothetical protein